MSRAPGATVGGQAVIEGVMMRAPTAWAVAVRTPDDGITVTCRDLPRLSARSRLARVPFIRGVLVLVESLTLGMKALSWSAQKAVGEDEEPLSGTQIAVWMTVAFVLFAALFMVLPVVVARWATPEGSIAFYVLEAVIRIAMFVGYIAAIGRAEDIRRVFQYHGAEHKTIHAYEAGDPLTVEEIQKYSPAHPRCGTSFLLLVLLISIVVFTLVGNPGWGWLIASRVLLIPVIAGVSYEILRLAGTRQGSWLGTLLAAPGLWLQRLTTGEPSDDQVEVAVASLLAALDEEAIAEVEARGPIVPAALAARRE